jgi:hypothetical protein
MTSTGYIRKFENSRHLIVGDGCFDAILSWAKQAV